MEEKNYLGHCIKCKSKKTLSDPMPHKQRNERSKNKNVNMMKGRCPTCEGIIYVVIGHD